MRETPAPGSDLYRDARNTGPQTRARYEYQDACVALRFIDNLLPGSPVIGIAVEWATDYVLLAADGSRELVSVKHRDPGQDDWSYADLKNAHVLQDLHAIWKAMDETGDYVFESNRGFSRTATPYVIDGNHPEAAQRDVVKLARDLGVDVDEAGRFLGHLFLRRDPLPDRRHIDDVAIRDLQRVMPQLGLDPARAADVYGAIMSRIAEASTQRPSSPADRIERMVGLMRDIAARTGPNLTEHYLAIDDLRQLVIKVGTSTSRLAAPLVADPLFVGREDQMALLDSYLDLGGGRPIAPVVLTGIPGIGKSALARQYAAERGSIVTAHVLPADSRAALAQALYTLTVGAPRDTSPDRVQRLPTTIARELPIPEDPKLLLIIDGVTDPATVEGLIPRRSATRFIMTATPTHLDDAFVHLSVNALDREDSVAYLRSVLIGEDVDTLGRVADVLAGHPLGLVQAASYCLSQRIAASGYLMRIDKALVPMLGLGRAPEHPTPTAVAILDMFKLAVGSEPAVVPLATVMSCAAPEPLPEYAFERQVIVKSGDEEPSAAEIALVSLTDVLTRDRAMAALHQFSLVIRENEALRIHPLVQSIIKEATPVDERPAWARAGLVLLLYAADPRDDGLSASSDLNAFGAHIAAAVEYAVATNSDPYIIYAALGWLGSWQLRYGELNAAVTYLTRCLQVAQSIPLPPAEIMTTLSRLAAAQRMAGMITEALASVDERLQLSLTTNDRGQIGDALLARAQTFAYAARYPEARSAFDTMTRSDDDQHLGTREQIFRLSLLADIEQGLGHLGAALDAITAAFALAPHVRDEVQRHDHLAALHKQAGTVLREVGRPEEALPHLQAAFEIGVGMPAVYTTESILGLVNVLLDLNRPHEARPLVDQGLVLSEVRGAESPLRGSFLQVRGRIALEAGEFPEARVDLEAAVRLLLAGGEPYRVNLASGYFNLGVVSTAQERYADAVDYFRLARDLDVKIHGADHGELIGDELSLAEAYYRVGTYSEAHRAIRRCLTLIRAGHPQGRRLRNRALEVAIAIDIELGLDGSES